MELISFNRQLKSIFSSDQEMNSYKKKWDRLWNCIEKKRMSYRRKELEWLFSFVEWRLYMHIRKRTIQWYPSHKVAFNRIFSQSTETSIWIWFFFRLFFYIKISFIFLRATLESLSNSSDALPISSIFKKKKESY